MNKQVQQFLEKYPDLKAVTVDRFAYTADSRKRDTFNSDNGSPNTCRVYDIIAGGNRNLGHAVISDEEFLDTISQQVRKSIGDDQHIIPVGSAARLTRHPVNGARLVYCHDDVYEPDISTLHTITHPLKCKVFKPEAYRELGITEDEEKQIQARIENSSRIKFRRNRAKTIAQFVLQNRPDDLEDRLTHGHVAIDLPASLVDRLGLAISNFRDNDSHEHWLQRASSVAKSILDFRTETPRYLDDLVLFVYKWWDPKAFREDETQRWVEETRLNIGILCRSLWLHDLYSEIDANLRKGDRFFNQIECSIEKDNLAGQIRLFLYPLTTQK